jgi:hypothetical protein
MPAMLHRFPPASLAAPLALCGCLLAAGCGGASGGAATHASASSSAGASVAAGGSTTARAAGAKATRAAGARPAAPSQRAAGGAGSLRGCLARHGIHLPAPSRGTAQEAPAGAAGAGALALPRGVSGARYRTALRACGAAGIAHPLGSAAPDRGKLLGNPAFKRALDAFVACMGEHGVHLPPPNTSGTGPVFAAGLLDTKSAPFKSAVKSCGNGLAAAFRLGAGASASAKPGSR